MLQTDHIRVHIVEAADWRDGVITLLAPGSPYRPWRHTSGDARPGDYAMLVLGTDPISVLTELPRVGDDGDLGGALLNLHRHHAGVVDLTSLATVLGLGENAFSGWCLGSDEAERVIRTLRECLLYGDPHCLYGHSSVVAARNLLRFNGECQGCGAAIDLSAADARTQVHVHTVDPSPRPAPPKAIGTSEDGGGTTVDVPWLRNAATDWPAVICLRCRDRMQAGGFTSFLDFRFAEHPQCPRCGGRRSTLIGYGEPVDPQSWEPWVSIGGCCVQPEEWDCTLCDHQW